MADLELGDALTDAPPEIEPEIKRDFISSLEAEAFDDVIGETCDKTDYVPLLDGDETDPKAKLSDGGHPESHAVVVANGEHGTGEIGVSDPFGSKLDEDVLADLLLPPHAAQIFPSLRDAEHLPDSMSEACLLDFGDSSGFFSPLQGECLIPAEAAQGAFDEGWLTDSYSKTGDTDTQSEDTSEKTTGTFGETPSDDSTNLPFQVTKGDHISDIWQPTAEEQLALSPYNPSGEQRLAVGYGSWKINLQTFLKLNTWCKGVSCLSRAIPTVSGELRYPHLRDPAVPFPPRLVSAEVGDLLFDAPVPDSQEVTESQLLPGLADQQLQETGDFQYEEPGEAPEYLSVDAEKALLDHNTVPQEQQDIEDLSQEVKTQEESSSPIEESPCFVHESEEDLIASEEFAAAESEPLGENIEQEQELLVSQESSDTQSQEEIPAYTAVFTDSSEAQIQQEIPADLVQESFSESPASPASQAEEEPPISPEAETEPIAAEAETEPSAPADPVQEPFSESPASSASQAEEEPPISPEAEIELLAPADLVQEPFSELASPTCHTEIEQPASVAAQAEVEPPVCAAAQAEIEALASSIAETLLEPATSPAAETQLEPFTSPAAETQLEPFTSPAAETQLEPFTSPAAETQLEPATSAVAETQLEPASSPVAETQLEPASSPVAETQLEPPASAVAETQLEPPASAVAETQLEPPASAVAETQLEPATCPVAETQLEPATCPIAETQLEPPASAVAETQLEPPTSAVAETQLEPATCPIAETQLEPPASVVEETQLEPSACPIAETQLEPPTSLVAETQPEAPAPLVEIPVSFKPEVCTEETTLLSEPIPSEKLSAPKTLQQTEEVSSDRGKDEPQQPEPPTEPASMYHKYRPGLPLGPKYRPGLPLGPRYRPGLPLGPRYRPGLPLGPRYRPGLPLGPRYRPGLPLGPRYRPGLPLGPRYRPGLPLGPRYRPGLPLGPRYSPGFRLAPDTGPGFRLAPDTGPGFRLAPDTGPGFRLAPDTGPGFRLAPDTGPGFRLAPDTGPGFRLAPDTGPGFRLAPDTGPGFRLAPDTGPGFRLAPDTGPGFRLAPDTGPGFRLAPDTGPGFRLAPDTGPGFRLAPDTGPGFRLAPDTGPGFRLAPDTGPGFRLAPDTGPGFRLAPDTGPGFRLAPDTGPGFRLAPDTGPGFRLAPDTGPGFRLAPDTGPGFRLAPDTGPGFRLAPDTGPGFRLAPDTGPGFRLAPDTGPGFRLAPDTGHVARDQIQVLESIAFENNGPMGRTSPIHVVSAALIKQSSKTRAPRPGKGRIALVPFSDDLPEPGFTGDNTNLPPAEYSNSLASRAKALHKKARDIMESRQEYAREAGDPEGLQMSMRRKKKKPKQRKNFYPKELELEEEMPKVSPESLPADSRIQATPVVPISPKEGVPSHALSAANTSDLLPRANPATDRITDAANVKDSVVTLYSPETVKPALQNINHPLLPPETSPGDQVDCRLFKPQPFQTEQHGKPETSAEAIFGLADADVSKCPYFRPELAVSNPAREPAQREKANGGERKAGYHHKEQFLSEGDYWAEKLGAAFPVLEVESPFLASGMKWDKPKKRDKRVGDRSSLGYPADVEPWQAENDVFKTRHKNIPVDILFDEEVSHNKEQAHPATVPGEEKTLSKEKASNRRPIHKQDLSSKSSGNVEPPSGTGQRLGDKSPESSLLGSQAKVEQRKIDKVTPLVADTPLLHKVKTDIGHIPNFDLGEAPQALTAVLESTVNIAESQKALGVSSEENQKSLGVTSAENQKALGVPSAENQKALGVPAVENQKALGVPAVENQKALGVPAVENQKALGVPSAENQKALGVPSAENQKALGVPSAENQKALGVPSAENQKALGVPAPENQKALGVPAPENQKALGVPAPENQKALGVPAPENQKALGVPAPENQKALGVPAPENQKALGVPAPENQKALGVPAPENQKALGVPAPENQKALGVPAPENQKALGVPAPENQKALGVPAPENQKALGVPAPENQKALGVPVPENQKALGVPAPENQKALGVPSAENQKALGVPSAENQKALGVSSAENQKALGVSSAENQKALGVSSAENQKALGVSSAENQKALGVSSAENQKALGVSSAENQKALGVSSAENQKALGVSSAENQKALGVPAPENQKALGVPAPENQKALGVPAPENQKALGVPAPENQKALGVPAPENQKALGVPAPENQKALGVPAPENQKALGVPAPENQKALGVPAPENQKALGVPAPENQKALGVPAPENQKALGVPAPENQKALGVPAPENQKALGVPAPENQKALGVPAPENQKALGVPAPENQKALGVPAPENQKALGVASEVKEAELTLGAAEPDVGQSTPENKCKVATGVKGLFPESSVCSEIVNAILPGDQPVSARKGHSEGKVSDRQTKNKKGKIKPKTTSAAFPTDESDKVAQTFGAGYKEPSNKAERGSLKRPHSSEKKDSPVLPDSQDDSLLTNADVAQLSVASCPAAKPKEDQVPLLEKGGASLTAISENSQNDNLNPLKSQDFDLLHQLTDILTLTSDVPEKVKPKQDAPRPPNIALESKMDTVVQSLAQELAKADSASEVVGDGRVSLTDPVSQISIKDLIKNENPSLKKDKEPRVHSESSAQELSRVVTETRADPAFHSSVQNLSKDETLTSKPVTEDTVLISAEPQSSVKELSKNKASTREPSKADKGISSSSDSGLLQQTGPFRKIKGKSRELTGVNDLEKLHQYGEAACPVRSALELLEDDDLPGVVAQTPASLERLSGTDTVKMAECATSGNANKLPTEKRASGSKGESKPVDSGITRAENNQTAPCKTELQVNKTESPLKEPQVQGDPLATSGEDTIQSVPAKTSPPALKPLNGEATNASKTKPKSVVSAPKKERSSERVPNKSTKTEGEKAKAPEVIKGYMRPTKSRSVALAPRTSNTEVEKSRPSKDGKVNEPRPDKGKAAVAEPVEARAGSDITAPPNKELPASPEKKIKATTATPPKAAATPKGKLSVAPSPKKPLFTAPGQAKKPSSPAPAQTAGSTPKRPLGITAKASTPRESKDAKPKSPVKTPEKKTPTPVTTTPRPSARVSPVAPKLGTSLAAGGSAPKPNVTPKRPSSVKNDVKPTDAKKPNLTKSPAESSRLKADTVKTNGVAPTCPAPSRPKATKPAAPRPTTGPSASADTKKVPAARPAPLSKPSTAPTSKPMAKQPPRPATAPDLKNIRSKIGSTDNLKHQPGGGKAKVEKKPVPASTARKPVPPAAPKPAASKAADTKETAQKQSNGKVQIVSKKANYSHVQSKCGSKDNIKHVPGGGNVTNATKPSAGAARPPASSAHKPGSANVQITNKKIDVSKVSAKCGSKPGTKHKTGKWDSKSEENSKKSEVTKQKPQDSTKENEVEQETPSQNGDLATPTAVTAADTRENGMEEPLPVDGDNQREIQSFNALIPETSI
ncbi:microtubule-associated protein 4 [Mantella aurantiaca]